MQDVIKENNQSGGIITVPTLKLILFLEQHIPEVFHSSSRRSVVEHPQNSSAARNS